MRKYIDLEIKLVRYEAIDVITASTEADNILKDGWDDYGKF